MYSYVRENAGLSNWLYDQFNAENPHDYIP